MSTVVVVGDGDGDDAFRVLWSSWGHAAGASGHATIQSLNHECLRRVLVRLPAKERYLAVCKLFRHELLQLATSASRLDGWRLHATHPHQRDLPPDHPNHLHSRWPSIPTGSQRGKPVALAPLPDASRLTSLSDGLAAVCTDGWPVVLTDVAAQTRLQRLALTLQPWSAVAASQLAGALPACTGLMEVSLSFDSMDVAEVLAVLPELPKLCSLDLQYSGWLEEDFAVLLSLPALERLRVTACNMYFGCSLWETVLDCPHLTSVALAVAWPTRSDPALPHLVSDITTPYRSPLASVDLAFTRDLWSRGPMYLWLEALVADLGRLSKLEHLSMSTRSADEAALKDATLRWPEGVKYGELAPPSLTTLLAALPTWPRLQTLAVNLEHAPALNTTLEQLLPAKLRSLSINAGDPLRNHILRHLDQCPSLAHVGITNDDVHAPLDVSAQALLTAWLRTLPALESLTLDCQAHDSDLLASLQPLTTLTALRVVSTSADAVSRLAQALPPQLAVLRALGVTAAAAPPLLARLPTLRALRELDLSCCDRGVVHGLAALLPQCAALQTVVLFEVFADSITERASPLSLRWEKVSGWEALADALPRCPSLEVLRIGDLDTGRRKDRLHDFGHGDAPGMVVALSRGIVANGRLRDVELLETRNWLLHAWWRCSWSRRSQALVVCMWVGIALGFVYRIPLALACTLAVAGAVVTGGVLFFALVNVPMMGVMFCMQCRT